MPVFIEHEHSHFSPQDWVNLCATYRMQKDYQEQQEALAKKKREETESAE